MISHNVFHLTHSITTVNQLVPYALIVFSACPDAPRGIPISYFGIQANTRYLNYVLDDSVRPKGRGIVLQQRPRSPCGAGAKDPTHGPLPVFRAILPPVAE